MAKVSRLPQPFTPNTPAQDAPQPTRLTRVVRVERLGSVLQAATVGGEEVFGLDLTRGCVQRCVFCPVRAAAPPRADEVVYLYADLAKQLAVELAGREPRPRAVLVSPTTDPFPPVLEIQQEAARVVEALAQNDVEAWLMTRGYVRPPIVETLAAHARHVKVTVGLTTCDRHLQRLLEPWTAPPRLRLRQIADLRRRGLSVRVAVEPLLPGLTDTRANLEPLLKELAAAGVRQVTAGYAYLRGGVDETLTAALGADGWGEAVLGEFADGPQLAAPGSAAARYLPRARRQRGYALLMALAAEHGVSVSVSRLSNPDFAPPPPPAEPPQRRLLPLFRRSLALH